MGQSILAGRPPPVRTIGRPASSRIYGFDLFRNHDTENKKKVVRRELRFFTFVPQCRPSRSVPRFGMSQSQRNCWRECPFTWLNSRSPTKDNLYCTKNIYSYVQYTVLRTAYIPRANSLPLQCNAPSRSSSKLPYNYHPADFLPCACFQPRGSRHKGQR